MIAICLESKRRKQSKKGFRDFFVPLESVNQLFEKKQENVSYTVSKISFVECGSYPYLPNFSMWEQCASFLILALVLFLSHRNDRNELKKVQISFGPVNCNPVFLLLVI